MYQKCKKILSVLLSIAMLISITARIDLSAYAKTSGDFVYQFLDNGTAEISTYGGYEIDLIIPSEIDGYTVTSIGERTFCGCTSLTSVTIPDSVISIGTNAFEDCTSLTSVTIGNSVKSIGDCAFSSCTSLTSVTIPNSVTSIGDYAFCSCYSLTGVTIPNSVTSIGERAFSGCDSLTSVTIGNSVTSIGNSTFWNCSSLTSVTIGNSVKSIGICAFCHCYSLTSVTIPNSVTSIGDSAFRMCYSLTGVTIPNSVTSMGDSAFESCKSLTSVTIGNSVKSIGYGEFYDCPSLKDVYYSGTQEEWNNISIGLNNEKLINANIHYNYIPPCDVHTPVPTVKENVINATCTTAGSYDSVVYCSVCKQELSRTKKTVAKKPHTYKTYTTKATTSAAGKITTKCSVCGAVKSTQTIARISSVKLSSTSYTYDGKVKTPSVIIKNVNGKALVKNTDYTVSCAKGRKYVGKYAVKVTFKGKYSGTKTLYFTIKPKSTSISSISARSKGFTVKWYKRTTQTTGYQVQYSTSSKFTSPKTVTISSTATTSKTVSKLTAKKRYYVRVRTYKTVNGTRYYSSWSKAKYVTTKS